LICWKKNNKNWTKSELYRGGELMYLYLCLSCVFVILTEMHLCCSRDSTSEKSSEYNRMETVNVTRWQPEVSHIFILLGKRLLLNWRRKVWWRFSYLSRYIGNVLPLPVVLWHLCTYFPYHQAGHWLITALLQRCTLQETFTWEWHISQWQLWSSHWEICHLFANCVQWYGNGAGNTVQENSSIFSLIRIR